MAILGAGAAVAWRADSPLPLVGVGLVLVLLSALGDRIEEVVWQGLTVRLRKAVESAETKSRDLRELLDELRAEVDDIRAAMPSPLSITGLMFNNEDPETGQPSANAGFEVEVTAVADAGLLTFEVTLPDGSTQTYERDLRPPQPGQSLGCTYILDLGVPWASAPDGVYEVSVRGARGGLAVHPFSVSSSTAFRGGRVTR